MKIVGLIAEYNPFHKGHQYQLQKIRAMSQCDILIVVMSGNVVQRGQFAVLDKWHRAEIAIQYGADFVFELPLLASLQAADYFAKVGIELLSALQCREVYFGSESADITQLEEYVRDLSANQAAIDSTIKDFLGQGFSYAASFEKAVATTIGTSDFDSSLPNHQLGIQYIKANQQLPSPMILQTIQRIQDEEGIYSASQVREQLKQHQLIEVMIPQATWSALISHPMIEMNDYWPMLQYQLATQTPASLAQILGVKEGFEKALLTQYRQAGSWEELASRLTSKRWTTAAVNRILMAVLANITKSQWNTYQKHYQQQKFVRLLAYRESKNQFLKDRRDSQVMIISNWKKEYQAAYQLQWRLDEIYQLNPHKVLAEQNLTTFPIKR